MDADQLARLGKQVGMPLFQLGSGQKVVGIALHELQPHLAKRGLHSAARTDEDD